jgi:hypothetical protein
MMDNSTSTVAGSGSDFTHASMGTVKGAGDSKGTLPTETSRGAAGEGDLDPISPIGEQPCFNSNVRLDFEAPFQKTDKVIVRNGSAALTTAGIMKADRSQRLWRFMDCNFPIVNEIHVKFTIGASWSGGGFSNELQTDVKWCAEAALSMMKQRQFFLEVGFPFSDLSEMQEAMLSLARRRILLIFHDEARKIDSNYALLMD